MGLDGRCEQQSPIHSRKEDMHLLLLSQLPIQTPVNWFHTIQASLIRVYSSIKRSHTKIEIFTLYVLCECEEEQPSNFSRYIQAICK